MCVVFSVFLKREKHGLFSYICSMVDVAFCFHQVLLVLYMCCIVQVTVVCPSKVKINADTVVFHVALQFTGILVQRFDGSYYVINQSFSIEEIKAWKLQFTALI